MTTTPSLYEQIKADLGYLKLDAAAGAFATLADQARTDGWSHIEFLARLVAEQVTADRDRRLAARLHYARFPYRRTIDDFDFEFRPTVDRKLVDDLATLAVEAGYRCYFTTSYTMSKTLVRAQLGGSFTTKLKTYTAPTVLVIDDVGLLPIGGTDGAAAFFHVVNTRHDKGHPTIVTTNRGLPAWGEIFGDTVVAAAILDRPMHHAVVFNIRGPSWRLREHNGLEIATRTTDR